MPLPPPFRRHLPDEKAFDEGLARVIAAHGARFAGFSSAINDPRLYFDTDHLNRAGLTAFVDQWLMPLLIASTP
jgi:hypothetical protein